ncbi:MAG: flagellar motor switch protein FliN [Oceanococcus sp.]
MTDMNEQLEQDMSPEERAQIEAMQAQADLESQQGGAQPAEAVSAVQTLAAADPAEGYTPPAFGEGDAAGEPEINLDLILDVPVTLSMEVGHAKVPIRNLLQLNQGSVVELDRTAGEPLDVYVNGTLIAHGEVVVVNDKFGVRLLDVVSPAERIRKLK